MQKQKRENIRRAVFLIYLMLTIRLIIFKYPFADLKEIMDTWQSGVILRGLETANFRLFKTVRMYIVYRDRLNSFENLFGNVAIFIPFGALLPWVDSRFAAWWKVLVNAFLFVVTVQAGLRIYCADSEKMWWQQASDRRRRRFLMGVCGNSSAQDCTVT